MKSKISTILFLVICIPAFAQNGINIISSNRNSIVIEYTPSFTDTAHIKINNQDYFRINLREGFFPDPENFGTPAIPQRAINIGVPSEYGNTIKVLNYTSKEINYKLAPKPRMVKEKDFNNFVYEINNNYYNYKDNNQPVSFGDYGIMRGIPVQTIIIDRSLFLQIQ